ncbi:hypothetical protein [Streptomyces sp. NPDC008121]|uniref:hypothetical protein n=1 Tax=Streptomyces sp. NPDC008121 TaxID=3364809 RepID=UPI0036E55CA1
MRLRNALALGVTAATTGTAVLALTAAPAPAAAPPAVSADTGPGAGTTAGPDGSAGSDGPDAGPGLLSGTGTGLLSGEGTPFGPRLKPAPTSPPAPSPDAGSGPGGGPQRQDTPPTCGKESDPDFPLDTRIHGGPATYAPGDDFRTWNVDLTNTTTESCHSIHPVLALTDRDRTLTPAQINLEFHDSEADRWRPVPFEGTDQDENIGVFADIADFVGFTVPAGRTVTVPVRLSFRADAAPNEVVVRAAVVQRNGDDGDWVGESGDYRLRIADGGDPEDTEEPRATETPEATKPPGDPEAPRETKPQPTEGPSHSVSPTDGATPPESEAGDPPLRPLPELAHTGPGPDPARTLAPLSGALLLSGAALSATARRRSRTSTEAEPAPVTDTPS